MGVGEGVKDFEDAVAFSGCGRGEEGREEGSGSVGFQAEGA